MVSKATIDYREHDRQIWEEELDEFVPDRVFDAHCHLFQKADFTELSEFGRGRKDVDIATLRAWGRALYPGRTHSFLLLGTPIPGIDVDAHVRTVTAQLEDEPDIRHFRVVTPTCDLAKVEEDLQAPNFIGLKPYRTFSVTGDIAECRIHEYLLHEQMELANDRGLWVTLHLSKHHGCADADNLNDLEEFTTRRYPNIRWILAHCARSFTYWPIRQAIERLRDMPNIHYDLSAVTDLRPHLTLFSEEDTSRLFYGSDAVAAAYFHGQYPALGRAWQYLQTDEIPMKFPHCDGRPILSVYEQLLSMKHAAEIAGLSREQVEGIFWNNATTALGI